MGKTKLSNSLGTATILAASVWLYSFFSPHVPALDRRPRQAAGDRLAREAVRRLEPGARLIVLARDSKPSKVEANEVQMDAFLGALKKAGQSVAVTHRLRLDPLRPPAVTAGDFIALLKSGQENDVIVSFLGPPVLSDEQAAALSGQRPQVIALCPRGSAEVFDLKRPFQQKLLAGAAVLRLNAPVKFAGANQEEAFNHLFAWITPANLADLDPITVRR